MVLVVEIEDRTSPKPFLGGWRNVSRDLEYHDATTQTLQHHYKFRRNKHVSSTTVQTSAQRRSKSIRVGGTERAVQTDASCFPKLQDYIIIARDPEDLRCREDAAMRIQRFYRAHRHPCRFIDDKAEESRSSGKFIEESQNEEDNNFAEDRSATISGKSDYQCVSDSISEFDILHPSDTQRDPTDYGLLRSLLERWGVAEEVRIRESYEDEKTRIAAQTYRLEREIEILRAIECSRSEISRKRNERVKAKFLDELAKPIDLKVHHAARNTNDTVHIETLKVQRAREFRDLYETLLNEDEDDELNEFARVDLLFALKKIAFQHTCIHATNLKNLIDQELFLLSARVKPASLRNLRSRIRLCFLRLARGELRPDNRNKLTMRTQLCLSCSKLRPLEAFEADHRERLSRICIDCVALKPRRQYEPEVSLEIYESMLKELRRNEATRPNGSSSLAFVIGPNTIRYLVKDIWHGRSVISECDKLENLRLVRLDYEKPWSPWNNLLLTRHEASMHETLSSYGDETVYDAELVRKLRRMNLQARLYFEEMAKTAECGISL